jgi:hypothetical protein
MGDPGQPRVTTTIPAITARRLADGGSEQGSTGFERRRRMTAMAERSTASPARESLTMTVGEFLLRRIREAGVGHAFGVPGDFNLELLQQLEDTGILEWIGTCNELNASYAADGYARLNGLAALVVTNGVGALSAINGSLAPTASTSP